MAVRKVSALARRLAGTITGSRAAFRKAFRHAQRGLPGEEVVDFLAIAPGENDAVRFARAFAYAEEKPWLPELVGACLEFRVADQEIVDELARGKDGLVLQSMQSYARGFQDPVSFAARMLRFTRQVCLVNADGTTGTGCLISPHIVLTSWHVVRKLLDATTGKELPGSEKKLTVQFDHVVAGAGNGASPAIPARANWLLASSPCHDNELKGRKTPAATQLADKLDFALIRLEKSPGRDRTMISLAEATRVGKNDEVMIFQHPEGWKLMFDHAKISKQLGDVRLYHTVNTLSGSSGAPCLNRDFKLVGIHQAGIETSAGTSTKKPNRAVTALAVANQVKALRIDDPAQRLRWRTNEDGPVIGCTPFQMTVLESNAIIGQPHGAPRILSVTGPTLAGKTHSKRLLGALLDPAAEVFLDCPAPSFPAAPDELVDRIYDACGQPRDRQADPLPARSATHSTVNSWIRDTLCPAVGALCARAAGTRRVWLAIDQMDNHTIPPGDVRDLLMAMLEQIGSTHMTWLRIAMFGFKGAVPGLGLQHMRTFALADPSEQEVAEYLNLHLAEAGMNQPDAPTVKVIIGRAQDRVKQATNAGAHLSLVAALEALFIEMPEIVPVLPPGAGR